MLCVQLVELSPENDAISAAQSFCGADVPAVFTSVASRVQVKFRSNRDVNDVGFSLNFTAGPLCVYYVLIKNNNNNNNNNIVGSKLTIIVIVIATTMFMVLSS